MVDGRVLRRAVGRKTALGIRCSFDGLCIHHSSSIMTWNINSCRDHNFILGISSFLLLSRVVICWRTKERRCRYMYLTYLVSNPSIQKIVAASSRALILSTSACFVSGINRHRVHCHQRLIHASSRAAETINRARYTLKTPHVMGCGG